MIVFGIEESLLSLHLYTSFHYTVIKKIDSHV